MKKTSSTVADGVGKKKTQTKDKDMKKIILILLMILPVISFSQVRVWQLSSKTKANVNTVRGTIIQSDGSGTFEFASLDTITGVDTMYISNDTIVMITPTDTFMIKVPATAPGAESDPIWAADSTAIKDTLAAHNTRLLAVEGIDTTGIYHANRALLDAIDASDTTRWGTDVTFSQTAPVVITRSVNDLAFSLATGYGDTQNPYASKTANYVLAAPNGSAGAPTFRALTTTDIPALPYSSSSHVHGNITNSGTIGSTSNLPVVTTTGGTVTTGSYGLSFIGNGTAQYQVPLTGATTFTPTWTTALNLFGSQGLNGLTYGTGNYFVKMTGTNTFTLDNTSYMISVTGGAGLKQTGTTSTTLDIISRAGTIGSVGQVAVVADSLGVVLGTTGITAFRGDYGNAAYNGRIASFTTTGNSGVATFSGNTLNIPNYTLSGLNGVEKVASTDNAIARFNLTAGQIQNSLALVGDLGEITTPSTIQGTTGKFTNLTDNYVPYHVSDAAGLANSNAQYSGGQLFVGIAPSILYDGSLVAPAIVVTSNTEESYQVPNIGQILANFAPLTGSANYIQNQNTSAQTANMWINGNVRGNTLQSTVATGTAPLTVASTTMVTNLNADLLDGQHGSYYQPLLTNPVTGTGTANHIPKWGVGGTSLTGTSNIYDNGTNVGVGTTSPSEKLDVNGNMRVRSVGTGTAVNTLGVTSDGTLTTNTSGFSSRISVTQTTHGFSVGDWIYLNVSTFAKAKADAHATSDVVGVVQAVADANNFTYQYAGIMSGSYTAGQEYYLSTATAGVAGTEPSYTAGQVRQFVGTGLQDGSLLIEIDIGLKISDPTLTFDLPATLGTDHTYNGNTITGTAGENLVFGDFVYFKFSDLKWWKADCDAYATARVRGIAVATINSAASGKILTEGVIRDDSWNWTAAGVWLSGTAGAGTSTQPSTTGQQIQFLGTALSADHMLFKPSQDIGEK